MTNSAEMLLKKMGEDKSFAEKILSQTEKEKVIEIAKDEGIELTMEDIDEINEAIGKALQQNNEGELTEEELENVAGGDLLILSSIVSMATVSAVTSVSTVVVTAASATVIATSVSLVSLSAVVSAKRLNN